MKELKGYQTKVNTMYLCLGRCVESNGKDLRVGSFLHLRSRRKNNNPPCSNDFKGKDMEVFSKFMKGHVFLS